MMACGMIALRNCNWVNWFASEPAADRNLVHELLLPSWAHVTGPPGLLSSLLFAFANAPATLPFDYMGTASLSFELLS